MSDVFISDQNTSTSTHNLCFKNKHKETTFKSGDSGIEVRLRTRDRGVPGSNPVRTVGFF